MRRRPAAALLVALVLAACSGGGDDAASTTTGSAADGSTTTAAAEATTTTAGAPEPEQYQRDVEALAADAMQGRDNGSPGSLAAQDYLVDQLSQIAEPLAADFRVPFAQGTNLIGVIRGTELPDQYLVIGAHYDHLGSDCRTSDPADTICNGATDDAAGVAAALEAARRIAADPDAHRRSVIVALWDAEEDGLLGSTAYVAAPLVPLAQTVAYVNWDIQGANLLPSLRGVTVLVGAETGGPNLVAAADRAVEVSALDTLQLSLLFGQGRSDHAVFAGAGVPVAFFSDSTSACYHTAQDDVDAVDFDKLGQQIAAGAALVRELATTDTLPVFDPAAPAASYDDAVSMLEVVQRAEPDFGRFSAEDVAQATQYETALQAIVDAGPAAFDGTAVGTVLTGAAHVVELLTGGTCDPFLG